MGLLSTQSCPARHAAELICNRTYPQRPLRESTAWTKKMRVGNRMGTGKKEEERESAEGLRDTKGKLRSARAIAGALRSRQPVEAR